MLKQISPNTMNDDIDAIHFDVLEVLENLERKN